MIELITANIVILANHLPSILTPTWVKDKKIIEEEAKQFVTTSTFSLFESEHYVFTADPVRLQLSTKLPNDEKSLKHIPEALEKYVDNFKGLTFKALGLNFILMHRTGQNKQYNISTQIQYSENSVELKRIFDEHTTKLGSILYVENPPYRLRLVIEPTDESSFKYDFNYHYDIPSSDTQLIKEYLNAFAERYENSKLLIRKIVGDKDE